MSVFNIRGKQARQRAQASRLRRMARLEAGLRNRLYKELNRQYLSAAGLVEHGTLDVDTTVAQGASALMAAFLAYYRRAGTVFSNMVFSEFDKDVMKGIAPAEVKGMESEFWLAYEAFIKRNAAQKVAEVTSTTKKLLQRTIARGARDGLSYAESAKEIRKKRTRINRYRALRIARTEIHGASNYATDQAVNSTRLPVERQWTALFDDRVRTDHRRADGQTRPQGVDFRVGGEDLKYPGDPAGSPGNIINCRCVVMYHPARGGTQ